MTSPSSTFFAIIYEYDQISTPSFPNQFVKCSRTSSSAYNWCTMLGYPVNYIVEYKNSVNFTSTSISSIINITSGKYAGTFEVKARVFSAQTTIMKKSFNIVYNPYTIINNLQFYKDGSYELYKGSLTYY